MISITLPVLILKDLVLLPEGELRIEFKVDEILKNIELAEELHNNYIFIAAFNGELKDIPKLVEYPEYGVVAKISSKITLPNGAVRIVLKGIKRSTVLEYNNNPDEPGIIDALVAKPTKYQVDPKEESVLIKRLGKKYDEMIEEAPYLSNELSDSFKEQKSLNILTDKLANILTLSLKTKLRLLRSFNPVKRARIILDVIEEEMRTIDIEKELDHKVKVNLDNAQKEFILREKINVIREELGESSLKETEVNELREALKNLKAPAKIKARLTEEIKIYETIPPTSPEINMLRNYIDAFLNLPWEVSTKDTTSIKTITKSLDKSHKGLDLIKNRIIEYIAVKQHSPDINSPILCFVGPPGTGKTTLAISIAKSIKRNFTKMSVGGLNDESEIFGHRKTYIGAGPGKIIKNLIKSGSNNPVFLIDEIDKMTKSIHGDPASALLEVLDKEQNHLFTDNYLEESFDLSKIIFITTANSINTIPPALLDRLEIIELSSYTIYEKLDIAKTHLIPKLLKSHNLKKSQLNITDESLKMIITKYTEEAGIRGLERHLATIIRKTVVELLNNPKFNKKTVKTDDLKDLLGNSIVPSFEHSKVPTIGMVNILGYNQLGGVCAPLEAVLIPGSNNTIKTGNLGNMLKESIEVATNYFKSHRKELNINHEFTKEDIHVNILGKGYPWEGGSAGVAIATAVYSILTNTKIPPSIAMTGEITLYGNVSSVAGIKEKTIAAANAGIKTIFLPLANQNDLSEIPDVVKDELEIILISNFTEIINYLNQMSSN